MKIAKSHRLNRHRQATAPARTEHASLQPALKPATIVEVGEDRRVVVRVAGPNQRTQAVPARVARIAGYRPAIGDRVLVGAGDGEAYVVGVLTASTDVADPELALEDGTRARVVNGAIELRDASDRLLVRYADGVAEVTSPSRDLRLSAPHGRVVLDAGTDVQIHAARDLEQHAARKIDIACGAGASESHTQIALDPAHARVRAQRLDVATKSARVSAGQATILARSIATTAEHVASNVVRWELTATTIAEKARDAFREFSGLLQTQSGRARTLVSDVYTLSTRRSVMVSKDDTTIDGKKILIG